MVLDADRKVPGTHRTRTATQLLEQVAPLYAPAGITRVTDITGLDELGIPVLTAVRPNARSLSVSQGKGVTRPDAEASAVMEALETHAAETFRPSLLLGHPDELAAAGHRIAAVDELPRSPEAVDIDRELLWCAGTGMTGNERVYVPFDVVHVDWTLPQGYAAGLFPQDSNGLGSGSTPAEAGSHALCELIERDAAALFGLLDGAERAARRLDPSDIPDVRVAKLLERYAANDVLVGVWDLTTDTTTPTVLAHIVSTEPDPFRPLPAAAGLGTHPDATVAVLRALTEAAQSRLVTIAGARDDQLRGEYARVFDPAGSERVRAELAATTHRRHLTAWADSAAARASAAASQVTADLARLVAQVADITGHEPVAVDLTPPGWPIAVARVLAPGLEGAGAMFGAPARPGRRARRLLAGRAA